MMALLAEQYCKASILRIMSHLTFLVFLTNKTYKTDEKLFAQSVC